MLTGGIEENCQEFGANPKTKFLMIWQIIQTSPVKLVALVVMVGLSFAVEAIYRIYRRHEIYLPVTNVEVADSDEGTDV